MVEMRVREHFDPDALNGWLGEHLPELGPLQAVEQFAGGASNLTYLLICGHSRVVLRTSPPGRKAASAHDMVREARLLTALRPAYPEVPKVLAVAGDDSPLGRPAFVSEYIQGEILRRDLPPDAPAPELADAYVRGLARLHAVDVSDGPLADFHKGSGYVRRQVEGWSNRYRQARTDDVPDAEAIMRWLDANQPEDVGACVIHNDWRFDNLVLDPADLTRIKAVLDWELATVGDPFMDLGSALAYWVQADDDAGLQAFRMQPTNAAGMPTRDQIVDMYCHAAGRDRPQWLFYEVFGIFRLAVIAQQIWYRFRAGQSTNPAFAGFGAAVTHLMDRCQRLCAGSSS